MSPSEVRGGRRGEDGPIWKLTAPVNPAYDGFAQEISDTISRTLSDLYAKVKAQGRVPVEAPVMTMSEDGHTIHFEVLTRPRRWWWE